MGCGQPGAPFPRWGCGQPGVHLPRLGYPPGWAPDTGWSGCGAPGSKGGHRARRVDGARGPTTAPDAWMGPKGRPSRQVGGWGPTATMAPGAWMGPWRPGTVGPRPGARPPRLPGTLTPWMWWWVRSTGRGGCWPG